MALSSEFTLDSGLAALRAACSFHGLSTSGSKRKCFGRLLTYMKQVELETAREAMQGGFIIEILNQFPSQSALLHLRWRSMISLTHHSRTGAHTA
jgi:hypothetical protein